MAAAAKKSDEQFAFTETVKASVAPNCRARPALSTLIEMSPGMAGLALWVGHVNGDSDKMADGREAPAYTDSKVIVYNPGFAKFRPEEQVGVTCHEILHVALQHPQRGARMARVTPNFNHELANVAMDAIINESLKAQSGWARLPGKAVYLSELLDDYKKSLEKAGKPVPDFPALPSWSFEDVYHLLAKWRDDNQKSLEKALGCKLEDLGDGDVVFTKDDPNESREARDRREAEESLEWRSRLTHAQAGDRPGGILRQIAGDIPRVDTPWEKILQTRILRATQPRSEVTPTKPSRRWLGVSNAGRIPGHVYEPGIQHNPPGAKIAVMIDTSGSIGGDLLKRFCGEIDAIHKRTKAELHIVVCDAEVTYTQKITAGGFGDAVKKIQFKGGGGTDFRPAFAEAAKFKPAIGVYLTDLMGSFPAKAPFPTVWAVPTNGREDPGEAPFGVVLALR